MPEIQTPSASPAAPLAWWTDAVVYQVYPRSFQDSDGDGIGDLQGIRQRLPHLQDLGVDVVWLSPVYASPQFDNGYDISDYESIDPVFGTDADFDELLADMHARGIKLVMDLVVNHTSHEHAWFRESRSSVDSPKRDWYWWRPSRAGTVAGEPGSAPTNWGAAFGGSAWTLDEASGEHYLHLFAEQQPDLNWENPEVRQAVFAMMNRWLDRGVDGFRMDVVNFISKALPLRDGEVHEGELFGDGSPQFVSGPRIHEFLREMHREVFAGRDAELITVGEMPGVSIDDARAFTDPANGEVDMVFQFEHVEDVFAPAPGTTPVPGLARRWNAEPLDLVAFKEVMGRWQEGLAGTGWNSLYLDNHDRPRLVSRYGDDAPAHRVASAMAWATVLHLHRGTPYVYQGEEIGMTNVSWTSIERFRDIEALQHFAEDRAHLGTDPEVMIRALRAKGRDNARTPVQWDGSANAGFTTGTPWIDVDEGSTALNVEADRAAPVSVFQHYQRLIALRHASTTVSLGAFRMLEPEHPALYAFTRTGDGEELLVVGNMASAQTPWEADPAWTGAETVLASGAPDGVEGSAHPGGPVTLGPWEARILRRTR